MGRRKVGNLLGLAVLSYLSGRPMHPYELSRTLREHGDDRSIKFTHGSLYMVMGQLTKAEFVVPHETLRTGQRPERTVYRITDAGREELRDWLRELVEEPKHEFPRFAAALSFIGALAPGDVTALLRTRLARLTEQRAEIRDLIDDVLARGVLPLFVIEEEYRLALLDAEARFVESFIRRIEEPETGWQRPWEAFHQAMLRSPPEGE